MTEKLYELSLSMATVSAALAALTDQLISTLPTGTEKQIRYYRLAVEELKREATRVGIYHKG